MKPVGQQRAGSGHHMGDSARGQCGKKEVMEQQWQLCQVTPCAGHTFMAKGGSWRADFSALVYSGIGYRVLVNAESSWKELKGSPRKNVKLSNSVLKDDYILEEAVHGIITRLCFICLCRSKK